MRINTQTTRCASEELSDLEEWLKSKGMNPVEKEEAELQPGEYIKVLNEPEDETSGSSPTWTVTWSPVEE